MVIYLRMLGARVSLTSCIGSFWIYDWDLLDIGDYAILESNATLSPHLMNSIRDIEFDCIVLHPRAVVESNALVLGGTLVEEGRTIVANSRSAIALARNSSKHFVHPKAPIAALEVDNAVEENTKTSSSTQLKSPKFASSGEVAIL